VPSDSAFTEKENIPTVSAIAPTIAPFNIQASLLLIVPGPRIQEAAADLNLKLARWAIKAVSIQRLIGTSSTHRDHACVRIVVVTKPAQENAAPAGRGILFVRDIARADSDLVGRMDAPLTGQTAMMAAH
jgi:hypothetical protein